MEMGCLWRKCENPFLTLIEDATTKTKKQKFIASSEQWQQKCEAQKRLDRAGISKMHDWIVKRIQRIQKLCPEEMTTRGSITAAMRIAVLVHPDFVKQLHTRLVEGVGVFRTEPENDDLPAKITFSRGV